MQQYDLVDTTDRRVIVSKRHWPYFESDHVLNLTYNLLAAGQKDRLNFVESSKFRMEEPSFNILKMPWKVR